MKSLPEVVQDPEGVQEIAPVFNVYRRGAVVCVEFTRPEDPSAEYYEIMESLRLVGCTYKEAEEFIKAIGCLRRY